MTNTNKKDNTKNKELLKMIFTKEDYKMIRNSEELKEVINWSGRLSDLPVKLLNDDHTAFTPTKSSTNTPIKEDHKTMGVEDLSTPCSTVMGRASLLWTPSAIVA
jgi:uncharacterized membrane protein